MLYQRTGFEGELKDIVKLSLWFAYQLRKIGAQVQGKGIIKKKIVQNKIQTYNIIIIKYYYAKLTHYVSN